MFTALVMFCALQSPELPPNCLILRDKYGPYRTEENCNIRTNQMIREITADEVVMRGIAQSLGGTQLYYASKCEKEGEQA